MTFENELGLRVCVCKGQEVPLPNATTPMRVIRYPSSGLIEMIHENVSRKGLTHCGGFESLTRALYEKIETRRKLKSPTTKDTACENADYPVFSTRSEDKTADLFENDQTTETIDKCRGYKPLHQCYRKARARALSSVCPWLTVFLTTTISGKISFAAMMKIVALFGRWVKKLDGVKNAFVFPEPDSDGLGWHAHWFLCFKESIPETAEDAIRSWWRKHDTVPTLNNPFQLKWEIIGTLERLVKKLNYLNPTIGKKRALMPLYPAAVKLYRSYGEGIQREMQAIALFDVAEKVTKRELPSLRRSVEFTEPDSCEVVYSCATYFFEERDAIMMTAEPKRNYSDFEALIFISDECSRCCRGEPHEFCPKFCSGCDRFVKYDSA